jgi:hypothetical protein
MTWFEIMRIVQEGVCCVERRKKYKMKNWSRRKRKRQLEKNIGLVHNNNLRTRSAKLKLEWSKFRGSEFRVFRGNGERMRSELA